MALYGLIILAACAVIASFVGTITLYAYETTALAMLPMLNLTAQRSDSFYLLLSVFRVWPLYILLIMALGYLTYMHKQSTREE